MCQHTNEKVEQCTCIFKSCRIYRRIVSKTEKYAHTHVHVIRTSGRGSNSMPINAHQTTSSRIFWQQPSLQKKPCQPLRNTFVLGAEILQSVSREAPPHIIIAFLDCTAQSKPKWFYVPSLCELGSKTSVPELFPSNRPCMDWSHSAHIGEGQLQVVNQGALKLVRHRRSQFRRPNKYQRSDARCNIIDGLLVPNHDCYIAVCRKLIMSVQL